MPTYATISTRVTEHDTEQGIDATLYATPQSTSGLVTYTNENRITAGTVDARVSPNGAVAIKIPLGSDLGGLLWSFSLTKFDARGNQNHIPLGVYEITGDAFLDRLVNLDVTLVDATLATTVAEYVTRAESAALRAEAVGGTNDTIIASRINDPASATADALTTTLVGHVNGFRDAVDKIRSQQQNVHELIVTDSTGDLTNGGAKWTTGYAEARGALAPTHTVYEHTFDYGAANAWNAPRLVQTGVGYRSDLAAPRELHIWVAGWAGKNWSDWLHDSRRNKVFEAASFDVILFGMGHNDGATIMGVEPIKSRNLAFIEWVRTIRPRAQVILCSQNPRTATPGHAEVRNDTYRSLARERGYGYINITQAFHDDGRSLAVGGPLIDATGVHPTVDGYALWRNAVLEQVKAAPGAVPLPASPPSLTLLTERVAGMNVRPILSNGWAANNVTEASDATIVRNGAASSVKLTKNAAASAFVQRAPALATVVGRDVTAIGWVYVPATPTDVKLTFGWFVNGSLSVANLVDFVLRDQWHPIALTVHVPSDATAFTGRLWIDNDASADTPSVYVDRLDFVIGNLPLAVSA